MDAVLAVVVTNAASAGALALVAWSASLFLRRPAVVHALWAVVLLRLVAPPLLPLPLVPPGVTGPETLRAELAAPADASSTKTAAAVSPGSPSPGRRRGEPRRFRPWLAPSLALGAAVFAILTVLRARRFARLLVPSRPATADLAARIRDLAARLGLRQAPTALLVDARLPPLVWLTRKGPVLVLPAPLLASLADEELEALLVHELAHLRRRDHWFRFVEIVVTAFFWWYPVAWWARRQVRRIEEICCDEWVLRLLPAAGRHHAQGLLKAAAFASGNPFPFPATTSTALRCADLRDRLTAILDGPPRPPLGAWARAALASLAALALASFPASCRQDPLGELSVDLAVLAGAPGDPLVKYVGLPVKVMPETSFESHLEGARTKMQARAGGHATEARRLLKQGQTQLTAAWADVERTRAQWLSVADGRPEKRVAERAYVDAMRRKDDATRRAADLTFEAMGVTAAAKGLGYTEVDFDALPDPIAEARTGPDGGFTVRVPRNGRLVIAIPLPTQGRWMPLGTYSCYWQASLDGRPSKHLLLRGPSGVEGEPPYLVAYRPAH